MRVPMPQHSARAFPIKSVVIDSFDSDLNGIREYCLSFVKAVPLILDDNSKTYADELRTFVKYLIDTGHVTIDERATFLHIKTNTFKKISLSCLIDLRSQYGTDKRTATSKIETGIAN